MTDSATDSATGSVGEGESLRAVLADEYGLTIETSMALGGEVDRNTLVHTAEGHTYVVKASPPHPDLALIRWQHRLFDVVRSRVEAPPVPVLVPTRDGHEYVLVGDVAVRVLTWLPGRPLHQLDRHSPELLREWGATAARLVSALADHPPPSQDHTHHWELLRSDIALRAHLDAVTEPERVAGVERILGWFTAARDEHAQALPRQVVHQDLNDFNVLAARDELGRHHIAGVIDFADALHTARVSELAVAVAYAMLRKPDPLAAAGHVVGGYHDIAVIDDAELAVVFAFAAARLCVNAVTWTARSDSNPDYAHARMRHTWASIERLAKTSPELAHAWLRHAAGRRDGPRSLARIRPSPVFAHPVAYADLEVDGDGRPPDGSGYAGRHLTSRADHLVQRATDGGEPATIHLGVDVYGLADTEVRVPLAGTVELVARDADVGDADVLVRHDLAPTPLWSRWYGMVTSLASGTKLSASEPCGRAGPGLRVCLFTSAETARLTTQTWVPASLVPAWRAVSPDPTEFLGIAGTNRVPTPSVEDIVRVREEHFARSQRSYYERPMALVRGNGVWLYDSDGRAYLDAVNNVSHVGHANPAVARAGARQLQTLNTNSRFVYPGLADYSSRLASLLPDPLDVVFLVCTGSEANDLALRIARQVTAREDVLVIDGAYHGNTAAVTDISPNRYKGAGGSGRPPTTHEVPQPNRYRGAHRYGDPGASAAYAACVADEVASLVAMGAPPAAFIAESLMGTAGTIEFPPGYLAAAFHAVRDAGGLCISDEVQVGFGRLGDVFWGFQAQDVVPDIVTMGKPIGNGHPMAAVVTTRAIADAFDSGMKYFNTFGGNPVSCAIGNAVLDEIEQRGLQAHAHDVGTYLRDRLADLQSRHELIGDVRGHGLYLGVELVRDRDTQEPAGAEAYYVSERMKDEGCLVYPTGALDNVLKLKPPMVLSAEHADLLANALDQVLSRDW